MIRTRSLSRVFQAKGRVGEVRAVKGVDIDVAPGEIVGFLGPNGAGKTTTLRMLTTLLRPSGGEAVVAGCDLRTDRAGVRRRIGYVAQGSGASPDNSVLEELLFQGRAHRLSKADSWARATSVLDQLNLDGLDRRIVRTLSGGQQRRLDIALGLIHSPPLVFLDEPTAGLDPQNRASLWEHIRALRSEHNMTIFLTTHYLDEADALADRILVIDNGEIIAEGSPDSLKMRVSGDRIVVGVNPESIPATVELMRRLRGSHNVSCTGSEVQFRIPHGSVALPHVIRALDAAGITVDSLELLRPTLDDVFFALTGSDVREPEIRMNSCANLEVISSDV